MALTGTAAMKARGMRLLIKLPRVPDAVGMSTWTDRCPPKSLFQAGGHIGRELVERGTPAGGKEECARAVPRRRAVGGASVSVRSALLRIGGHVSRWL